MINSDFHLMYENFYRRKYPQQQMQLIRKRLKVEFWVDDQLRTLYDIRVNFI